MLFKVNELISLDLPHSYEAAWEDTNDGERQYVIRTGKQRNDEGETVYAFQMTGKILPIEESEDDKIAPGESTIDVLARRNSNEKTIISRDRSAIAVTRKAPIRFLGSLLKYYGILVGYSFTSDSVFLFSHFAFDKDDPEENALVYERVLTVIKAVRLRGNCPDFGISNAKELERKLMPVFDGDEDAVGNIGLKIKVGDNEVAAFDGNGEEIESYPRAFLIDDELHEHHDLTESASYTSRADADFVGQSILMLMQEQGNQFMEEYSDLENSGYYDEDEKAIELAKVFRLNRNLFDPYHDTEALIRRGMFAKARMFSALRSLAWTVGEIAENDSRQLQDFTFEELQSIGEHVKNYDYINYNDYKSFQGLCDHPDWHVFYVPEDFGSTYDMRYLCGKENRGGNTTFMWIPGMNDLSDMHRINQMISRNEETCASLDKLRSDLIELEPVMQTIHDGFMKDRDRSEQLEGPLADALIAWCALCVAAKEPFYSEEASDSPEANAGLGEPLERPTDSLPAAGSKRTSTATAPKRSRQPAGNVLDVGGKRVIEPNQFQQDMSLRNIVIPEGVEEIGNFAFSYCMSLESVVFPKSLRKICDFAFMGCRALKRVEFQDGIRELGDHVFGACSSLLRVDLPDSLEKVDRTVFGMGGDSPYATAYLSGKTAKRLGDIYARRLVIDGNGYDTIRDYLGIDRWGNPVHTSTAPKQNPASSIEDWMKKYGPHITRNPRITFAGKTFVFTGFGGNFGGEHPTITAVQEKGGIFRKSISGKTNYLVVDPWESGEAKLRDAISQKEKGSGIQIILKDDLESALKGRQPSADPAPAASARSSSAAAAPARSSARSSSAAAAPARSSARSSSAAGRRTQSVSRNAHSTGATLVSRSECRFDDDGALSGYTGSATRIILPSGITEIAENVFLNNDSIVYVAVPEGVRTIGNGAFFNCSNLEQVTLPESLESIDDDAFSLSKGIREIVLPGGCTDIGSAFQHCEGLERIVLPKGVQEVRDEMFSGCKKLQSISLPDTIRRIGNDAFTYCASLKEIIIPEGCMEIGDDAFWGCEKLKDIYIPESVTEIGDNAFFMAYGLTIHTVRGSAADRYAKEQEIDVAYDNADRSSRVSEVKTEESPEWVSDLYITLKNEYLLGKMNRSEDEFYELYGDDFSSCSRNELLQKRRRIIADAKPALHIPDEQMQIFKNQSLEHRFYYSVGNLFGADNTRVDFVKASQSAIERSQQYFKQDELSEVRQMMKGLLEKNRREIDEQYSAIEPLWKTFNGAKFHLKIHIMDTDAEYDKDCIFQQKYGGTVVIIKMSKPGMDFMKVPLINCMAWYWNVTPQQIWEQALKNGVEDNRSRYTGNAIDIARSAFNKTFPEVAAAIEREKAERQRREKEAQKAANLERIKKLEREISDLEYERDNMRGLFKGGKRKKIQEQIDELKRELNTLK